MQKIMSKFFKKENGDSNVMTILILIVVALGLCFLFRAIVTNIMENIGKTVTQAVANLSTDVGSWTPGT